MGNMEDAVRELIVERYGSVASFARGIRLPDQTVYSVLNKSLANASVSTVMPIASALGIDPFQLARGKLLATANEPRGYVDVALFGSIAAGQPAEALVADEHFPIPAAMHEAYPEAFLLEIAGESMNRILPNGCYALIDPCADVDAPGQPYAVSVGADEATVKRVRVLGNGVELVPDSTDPTFRPQLLDYGNPDTKRIGIIGRVIWYCLPYDWTFGTG